jgi:hypothetical protein
LAYHYGIAPSVLVGESERMLFTMERYLLLYQGG